MLLQKIQEDDLSLLIEYVTKAAAPQNVKKAIFRLPRYQLIKIIELAGKNITNEDIDASYEQYRYGLKPGFTLFSINQKCKRVSESSAYNTIRDHLCSIPYADEENIKSITAKAHSKISETVTEFSFFYLNKHSYLTDKEEPAFVYEYEECFAWIDTENSFLAIKNAPEKVLTVLKRAFSSAYDTQISNIKITKKLILDIFGDDKIKRGSYIKLNASQDEAEKITISDSHFSEKQVVQESISGHDMTGTFLNETVGDNDNNTLGINCNRGRIYLTSNVSATVFREWSVKRISSIISYLSDKADYSNFDVFQAKNITNFPVWDSFSLPQKKIIEKVCYAVYVASLNKQDSTVVDCDCLNIRNSLRSHFYTSFLSICDQCDEPFFPRCECGSASLSFTRDGKILCTDCGNPLENIYCELGHGHVLTNPIDIISLYPTAEMQAKVSETLKSIFNIDLSGSFYINNDRLTLVPMRKGGIIRLDVIPELNKISSISLSVDEYSTLLSNVQGIKEKCHKSTNKDCNPCLLVENPMCMMKLFSTFSNYRPSPHQAGEFGDVSFTVTLDGQSCELVGIAKSAEDKKDVLTVSENSAREMLQQVLSATHDARIGVIAAICPMRFHDQLVEELRYIAKLTGKRIVILDDMFMTRQYKVYEDEKHSAKTSENQLVS